MPIFMLLTVSLLLPACDDGDTDTQADETGEAAGLPERYWTSTAKGWRSRTLVEGMTVFDLDGAMDSRGFPHLLVSGWEMGELLYITWDGGAWDSAMIQTGGGQANAIDLELTPEDRPQSIFTLRREDATGRVGYDLMHLRLIDEGWAMNGLYSAPSRIGADIHLDASVEPYLLFPIVSEGEEYEGVMIGRSREGAWTFSVTGLLVNTWRINQLVLSDDGMPHFAHLDGSIVSYTYREEGRWESDAVTVIDSDDAEIDLALAADGTPHLLWSDNSAHDLHYARKVDGEWAIETLFESGAGYDIDLELDSTGRPRLCCARDTDEGRRLFYGERTETGWELGPVEPERAGGYPNCLAVDDMNRSHLFYYADRPEELRHLMQTGE
jgi:hypothetical protein